MNAQLSYEVNDPLLWPFLQAQDSASAQGLLAHLIQEHADPVIKRILRHKLRVSMNGSRGDQQNQDAMDIASELRANLIADLRATQENPDQKSILSFADYVAHLTYSACADYFREKNPQRWRLKNLLRYQLKQNPRFALWKAEDSRWYAGLSEWRDTVADSLSMPSASAARLQEVFPARHGPDVPPIELLDAIFAQTERPVEFDLVVGLAAEIWQVTDVPDESVDATGGESLIPSSEIVGADVLLEQRRYLEALWAEVCELPDLQRAALLLNLRDARGGSAIFFIPYLGIATHGEIAEILHLEQDDFAALWNELPLNDTSIAQRLGITRQQVINLRKTARERLARRMKTPDGKKER